MPKIQIVTDSCAHFATPHFLHQYPMVMVVPNKISIGGKSYREGVDLSPEEGLRLVANQAYAPIVHSPTAAEFGEVYGRLSRHCDGIISIHATREIYSSYINGMEAARPFAGSCPIAVIDSQNLCAGQGMLVKAAIKAMQQQPTLDDMVRTIRGAIERIYSVYYAESVSYLQQNKIMSASHSVLSNILGIKPFLSVEDGRMLVVEKVRTRSQAVERMVAAYRVRPTSLSKRFGTMCRVRIRRSVAPMLRAAST